MSSRITRSNRMSTRSGRCISKSIAVASSSRRIKKEDNNTCNEPNRQTKTIDVSHTLCMICMEPRPNEKIFRNKTCSCNHSYCSDCIGKHIAAKIQEKISRVNCPSLNCRGVLQPELCQNIIPKQVFDRWGDVLCESLILASQKSYCPFKDCSAALLIEDGYEKVTSSECPNCRRLFCAQCNVTWHSGMECGEFQRLGKHERGRDDLMAMELAKKNKWRRCPNCKFYVERREGCAHIVCRCRYEFCYGCGAKWGSCNGCSQR